VRTQKPPIDTAELQSLTKSLASQEARGALNEVVGFGRALSPQHPKARIRASRFLFWCHLFVPLSQQTELVPVAITKNPLLGCLYG
jgi:hypothetical protein